MIDHMTVGGGVWAAAGRRGTSLVFDLQPGLTQCLGEVVVHRACDGYRVGGGGLRLLVVLPETAAEMLLNHRVTGCIGCNREDRRKQEKERDFSSHNEKRNISKIHFYNGQWAIYCLASVETLVMCILGQWKNTNSDIYFTFSLQFFLY